jgi:hypothetical protein
VVPIGDSAYRFLKNECCGFNYVYDDAFVIPKYICNTTTNLQLWLESIGT